MRRARQILRSSGEFEECQRSPTRHRLSERSGDLPYLHSCAFRVTEFWKNEREARFLSEGTHSNQAAMRLCSALDYRKSKPTAPRLCCDEGIEQSVTNCRWDAGTLIDHKDGERAALELSSTLR